MSLRLNRQVFCPDAFVRVVKDPFKLVELNLALKELILASLAVFLFSLKSTLQTFEFHAKALLLFFKITCLSLLGCEHLLTCSQFTAHLLLVVL